MTSKELCKLADKLQDELEEAKRKGSIEEMQAVIAKLEEIKRLREQPCAI